MLKLLLWLKYLKKKKLVFLSIAAVALSCAMLIVVASLFIGFIGAFEETATKVTGDVLITPPIKFDKYDLFIEKLEANGNITAATATLQGNGLLHLGKSGNVKSVVIRGIDPAGQSRVAEFKSALHKQKNLSAEPVFATEDLKKGVGGFIGFFLILGLLGFAFWVWMLIDSLKRDEASYKNIDSGERNLWVVLMIGSIFFALSGIMALVYYCFIYSKLILGV